MSNCDFTSRLRLSVDQYPAFGPDGVRLRPTQREVAERMGGHPETVANYFKGRAQPDFDTCLRLADALYVNPCWLAFGLGPMRSAGFVEPKDARYALSQFDEAGGHLPTPPTPRRSRRRSP